MPKEVTDYSEHVPPVSRVQLTKYVTYSPLRGQKPEVQYQVQRRFG